ncbi:sacsin N-terminal ATP-binding-like domain-containing protein [Salinactinospora qingdaonensis]|uniref:Molecular chaperone Hsp90 n=1 Tax=Salinactinospora qingdaonensis TaxID=702744 RepID=A0ABP7GAG5_9ACTN
MVEAKVDPFETAEVRRRVLDGWVASAARFREDANAEEDYALGGYRDRVVVELAQNAADAARRAGTRGRLRLALRGREFTAANTGAPLTREGVESLSTLRASAKRPDTVDGDAATGRFGVGFSAVVPLSDEVTVSSREGAVAWSRERALEWVQERLPGAGGAAAELAAELKRRDGDVPLLRLPFEFETAEPVPEGYDTVVRLVLRDDDARAHLTHLLAETGQALLLALPDLAEVEIDVEGRRRVLSCGAAPTNGEDLVTVVREGEQEHLTRWRTVTRTGRFDPAMLADRPVEERERLDWVVTWAVAVDETGGVAGLPADVPRVVHAPTPSDTELDVPALLIGSFPLSPDRRRVAAGPARDALIEVAANAFCELLCRFAARATWDLIPVERMSGSEFDVGFRSAVLEPMLDTPFLVTAGNVAVRPRDAVVVAGGPELTEVLAPILPTVLPGEWNFRHPGLARLRLRHIGLAELADLLADLDREPRWWAELYAALRAAGQHGWDLAELGALPVPLADGRLVRGPRGLLVPAGEAVGPGTPPARQLAPLGLRLVHPHAVDPLLVRLGAVEAGNRAIVTDAATRAAVENSLEADAPDTIAEVVLRLVAVSGVTADDEPWLAELALPDDEGGYSVAGELLLPDSPLREIFVADAPFGVVAREVVARHGAEPLEAVGVVRSFTLWRRTDVTLGAALRESLEDLALDGVEEWGEEVAEQAGGDGVPPVVPELVGVRDLEFVREDRWPQALELLAAPQTRGAVVEPTRVLRGDGRSVDVPSYTAWWLRTGALLAGRRPVELRMPDAAAELRGLYDEVPERVDAVLARALGVRATVSELLAERDGPDELLERMADPRREVSREALRHLWRALAEVDPERVNVPERVRAVSPATGETMVADAEETVVVDAPDLLPLLGGRPAILVAADRCAALADVLDVALASEEIEGSVTVTGSAASTGEVRPVPDEVRAFLDTALLTYLHHDELLVDGTAVEWRYTEGTVRAATTDGLARALAWASGQWEKRHVVTAVLRDPQTVGELLAEADMDNAGPPL